MNQLLGILIILCILWVGKQIFLQYDSIKKKEATEEKGQSGAAAPAAAPTTLPGMAPTMEASLQAAQSQGSTALKAWLDKYRPYIRDPRLASIELDYVILVSRHDTAEAKRVFGEVKARTPSDSPLAARIKRLEKNF